MVVNADDVTPPVPADAGAPPPSYEAAVGELERLVAAMEGGQMPLDRLLEAYQRGSELLELCRGKLKAVEDRVRVLEDGRLASWNDA